MSTGTAVLEAVTTEPVTVAELAKVLGKSPTTIRKAVAELVAQGAIVEGKEGASKVFSRAAAERKARDTAAFDQIVLDELDASDVPLSKFEIAERIGHPVSKVYISLHRAGVQGRYDRHVTVVNDGTRTRKYRIG